MLVHKLLRWTHESLLALRYIKNIYQVGIQRQVPNWDRLRSGLVIKLCDRRFHFIHGDVRISTTAHRIDFAQLARDPIHVAQFGHRSPAAIPFAPRAARCKPYRKSFRKIFVRMFLRIPACEMAHVIPRERYRAVVIEVSSPERTEEVFPLRRAIELVSVIEGMTCFMTQVHHDLALVLEIVHLLLQRGQVGIRKIKRNSDHGFARRTSPFVCEIAGGTKLFQTLAMQLCVELVYEAV